VNIDNIAKGCMSLIVCGGIFRGSKKEYLLFLCFFRLAKLFLDLCKLFMLYMKCA